jgi:hypothetical protein
LAVSLTEVALTEVSSTEVASTEVALMEEARVREASLSILSFILMQWGIYYILIEATVSATFVTLDRVQYCYGIV